MPVTSIPEPDIQFICKYLDFLRGVEIEKKIARVFQPEQVRKILLLKRIDGKSGKCLKNIALPGVVLTYKYIQPPRL